MKGRLSATKSKTRGAMDFVCVPFLLSVVSGNINNGAISGVVKHLAKDRSEPWQDRRSRVGATPTRQNSGEPQLLLGKIYATFWD